MRGGREELTRWEVFFLLLSVQWIDFGFLEGLNPGRGLLLHERGLRRRPVVLRLRAPALRLPLRPLRRHQPLPAHCKPGRRRRRPPLRLKLSSFFSSLSSILASAAERTGGARHSWFTILDNFLDRLQINYAHPGYIQKIEIHLHPLVQEATFSLACTEQTQLG